VLVAEQVAQLMFEGGQQVHVRRGGLALVAGRGELAVGGGRRIDEPAPAGISRDVFLVFLAPIRLTMKT